MKKLTLIIMLCVGAYIYYNNFHYETDILDFRYAGAVPEEDLEYFMEYYPEKFGN